MQIQSAHYSSLSWSSRSTSLAVTCGQLPQLARLNSEGGNPSSIQTKQDMSRLSSFAFQAELSELTCSTSETSFTYRRDNTLALRATSVTNLALRTDHYRLEFTLQAEAFGLGVEHFADPSQPLTIRIAYNQSQLSASCSRSVKEVRTLRSPQDILQDLTRALSKVIQDPGNKTVRYQLDAEAIESLIMSDRETASLFTELITMMNVINFMKKMDQDTRNYVISLSGKGQPYLDVNEESRGELISQAFEVIITILPPGTDTASPGPGRIDPGPAAVIPELAPENLEEWVPPPASEG